MGVPINKLLQMVVDNGASDLHLTVGRPPTLRISGSLRSVNIPPLTAQDTLAFMKAITPERNQTELNEVGSTDFGFAFGDVARFRVSVFKQKGVIALVLRLIPNKLLSFEEIGLPPVIKEYLLKPRGLILVTGPTGSGKTTTLATMINFINEEAAKHIITIEDPIEYYHPHKRGIVNQREIGVDVPSFSEALRRALREDPDVILVGEMRDLETIAAAITAAETGHLVFATLHTTGAAETVDRIIDAFPTEQQGQIRTQLSVGLLAVISQQLLPKIGGGRVAAFEIMFNTPAVANLIRENKSFGITSVIQTSGKEGMITLDDHLFQLYKQKLIEFKQMMQRSKYPEALQQKVKMYHEQLEREAKKKKGFFS